MVDLREEERRFLSVLVETVREDLSKSDDLRDEHDADAYTRSMLLEGFPMLEEGLERVASAADVTDVDGLLEGLVEQGALELQERGDRRFLRMDEEVIAATMQER